MVQMSQYSGRPGRFSAPINRRLRKIWANFFLLPLAFIKIMSEISLQLLDGLHIFYTLPVLSSPCNKGFMTLPKDTIIEELGINSSHSRQFLGAPRWEGTTTADPQQSFCEKWVHCLAMHSAVQQHHGGKPTNKAPCHLLSAEALWF